MFICLCVSKYAYIKLISLLFLFQVKCTATGHEMPLRADAVKAYISSKKYKRAFDLHASIEYEKYKEHLVPTIKPDRK